MDCMDEHAIFDYLASKLGVPLGTSPSKNCDNTCCSRCNKKLKQNKAFQCSRCKFVKYCGKDCQVKDWKNHKASCQCHGLLHQNKGIIVEIHNYANLLSAINDVVGKRGPAKLDFEIREDVASTNPHGVDFVKHTTMSDKILKTSIGKKGEIVTLDNVSEMLETLAETDDFKIEYAIQLMEAVKGLIGMRGPVYFDHGIVEASNMASEMNASREEQVKQLIKERMAEGGKYTIPNVSYGVVPLEGERHFVTVAPTNKAITLRSFIKCFRYVSTLKDLEQFRKNGKSYFHEGFEIRHGKGGEKTLAMIWGSCELIGSVYKEW